MQRTEQIICIICIIIAAAMFAGAGIIAATPATPAPREIHQITRRVFRRKPKKETKMLMTKVRIEDLPTTATAGLDETVSPNPSFGSVANNYWTVSKGGSIIAQENLGVDEQNGWDVAAGGVITVPALADGDYGKYQISLGIFNTEDPESSPLYTYILKIVPPCPTGGTLTVTPR